MYIQVEGDRLLLPTGGGNKTSVAKRFPTIVARLTEPAPCSYREVAISRDARGHYYASFVAEQPDALAQPDAQDAGVLAFDLGIKTLATGVNMQGRIFHIGGFHGGGWYNRHLDEIRSKRDRCQKLPTKSRRYRGLSQTYQRVAEKKRNKQIDCLHKASSLIAYRLVASTVVIGDLSQRQMVMKTHQAKQKQNRRLHRAVYNDWGLYRFMQMLEYKCVHAGKTLIRLDERYTSKDCSVCGNRQDMPLWKRTYRCGNCGLAMDRDENSAVNILQRFLARPGPHTLLA
jgi:putative transposase